MIPKYFWLSKDSSKFDTRFPSLKYLHHILQEICEYPIDGALKITLAYLEIIFKKNKWFNVRCRQKWQVYDKKMPFAHASTPLPTLSKAKDKENLFCSTVESAFKTKMIARLKILIVTKPYERLRDLKTQQW